VDRPSPCQQRVGDVRLTRAGRIRQTWSAGRRLFPLSDDARIDVGFRPVCGRFDSGDAVESDRPIDARLRDLGPLAAVLERAGRPLPDDRYSAAEFGRALVQAAEKLPRPAPINLPNSGLFGDSSGAISRPALPPPVPAAAPLERPLVTTEYVPTNEEMASARTRPPEPEIVVAEPARRRRRVAWVLPLVLLLAAAAGGAAYAVTRDQTRTYQVPHLAGLAEAEALNQISSFDWDTVVTREASETVPTGIVIRTEPDEATPLAQNKPFQLIVSTGPAPRALPDLVGLTLDQATARLDQLGLVLKQSDPVFDETIPAGIVISWMVPDQPGLKAGETVTPKTTVAVVLSKGPQPRVVPNLIGLPIDQATAALTAEDLVLLQLDPEFSDTVAPGLIVRQDLPPDSNVDRGAVVSVAVSKGQDLVAVPSLGNLTLQQATDTLSAAGLTSVW